MESIPVAGARAAVRLFPSARAAAPTILALHGFTGSGADFLPLREAIGAEAYHWICPDFMGHGQSESPASIDPYLLVNSLALVDRARRLAPDAGQVRLIAYSMGGRIALHYLRHAPPLPAILIGASPGLDDPEERTQRRARDRAFMSAHGSSTAAFCDAWESQPLISPQTRLPKPLCSELASRRRRNRLQGLANSLCACGAGALPSLWRVLPELPPLACLYGGDDRKFAAVARAMADRNPRFQPIPVPGSGHAPHLEQPERSARILFEWLRPDGRRLSH
jgi:2-succinyl-6-hydroxy-2,4-cyclohexadiene-1-carboxylate synthase